MSTKVKHTSSRLFYEIHVGGKVEYVIDSPESTQQTAEIGRKGNSLPLNQYWRVHTAVGHTTAAFRTNHKYNTVWLTLALNNRSNSRYDMCWVQLVYQGHSVVMLLGGSQSNSWSGHISKPRSNRKACAQSKWRCVAYIFQSTKACKHIDCSVHFISA